jgi:hypothetical protein
MADSHIRHIHNPQPSPVKQQQQQYQHQRLIHRLTKESRVVQTIINLLEQQGLSIILSMTDDLVHWNVTVMKKNKQGCDLQIEIKIDIGEDYPITPPLIQIAFPDMVKEELDSYRRSMIATDGTVILPNHVYGHGWNLATRIRQLIENTLL